MLKVQIWIVWILLIEAVAQSGEGNVYPCLSVLQRSEYDRDGKIDTLDSVSRTRPWRPITTWTPGGYRNRYELERGHGAYGYEAPWNWQIAEWGEKVCWDLLRQTWGELKGKTRTCWTIDGSRCLAGSAKWWTGGSASESLKGLIINTLSRLLLIPELIIGLEGLTKIET